LPYATGSAELAITVKGSSRRIKIMLFRLANIRLINRRLNLPRLLLALSSKTKKATTTKETSGFTVVDTVPPYQGIYPNARKPPSQEAYLLCVPSMFNSFGLQVPFTS
jgi:hypothetical protein